jgi:hypothetical protein
VARAKHTDRAEARRRYRQTTHAIAGDPDGTIELESGAAATSGARSATGSAARPTPRKNDTPGTGRPSFTAALRGAYHRANIREDLGHLPRLLRGRAFLAGLGLVAFGAIVQLAFPGYNGSAFAWELLVIPGSALAPQLVAGFFAPRASYLLGLFVALAQGIVFTVFLTQLAARIGATFEPEQIGNLLTLSFVTGPISGILFAAAAAWYRRFLALSSPRRAGMARSGARPGKGPASKAPARRPAGR